MAIFEKRAGAPTGSIRVTTDNNTYTVTDGGTFTVLEADDIATLAAHPLVQLQGGTGGPYVAPPKVEQVFLKDGVLVRSSDQSPVATGGGGSGAAAVKDWAANDSVAANEVRLLPDGTLGRWIGATGTTGATFNPANWTPLISGTELNYAENTVGYTTASITGPAYEDITGLAFTLPSGLLRPVALVAGGNMFTGSVAGVRARYRITVDGAEVAANQATIVTAAEHHSAGQIQKRLPAGTGGAVKLQVGLFSGGPSTATMFAATTYPVWLQAVYL